MTILLLKKEGDFAESELDFIQRVEEKVNYENASDVQFFQNGSGIINKAVVICKN